MKLLVLSDLHLGFGPLDLVIDGRRIDAEADIVVLVGDIHEGTAGLTWARESFPDKPIVYVAGNHEFYVCHFVKTIDVLRQTAASLDIAFLENDAVVIDGVRFLGCTLWTDFKLFGPGNQVMALRAAARGSNDYACISTTLVRDESMEAEPYFGSDRTRALKPLDTLARHRESRAWLSEQLMPQLASEDPAKTVVVTHHAPSRRSVPGEFYGDLFSAAYASDLEELMGKSALWIHGHLHNSSNYEVNGTRVICNPRGYWNKRTKKADNPNFRANLIIDVPACGH